MKRILALFIIALMIMVILSGCNYQVIDTVYRFDRAIIQLPNGDILEGKVDSWMDYEDGDQIQVEINGVIYLVHSSNIVLIKEK